MEQAYTPFIIYGINILLTGIPTFFVTRKYGRNFKKDWVLILIPIIIWFPILGMTFWGTPDFSEARLLGELLFSGGVFGTIGYFIFRQKKKTT